MSAQLAIRVDVCNHRALAQGVPRIRALLAQAGVRATFFVAFGPDHSGRNLLRVFQRGFLAKMLRTRAPQMYGVRTLLYGTLLPGPAVGESFPDELRALRDEGHELGLHGFNHVRWQHRALRMDERELRENYGRAAAAFERALGEPPRASAAPGWQVSELSLAVADEFGFAYASDCRGERPFYPRAGAQTRRTLQLPTTLPTLDELIGYDGGTAALTRHYLDALAPGAEHALTVHAEAEGLLHARWFSEFLSQARERGVRFRTFGEWSRALSQPAPALPIAQREVPGRAGAVACAGA